MDAIVTEKNGNASDTETMMLFGGVACMIFGAGLVLSNPTIRRYLGQASAGNLLAAAVPDVEKYLRLRAM